ncbi:MAG: DNA topoisomerase VI subunit B [Candidatus Hodarchaeales archaeon]
MASVEIVDEDYTKRSAADFFHDNKAIAGFDNSLRTVFTSVRELVENGLDASEKIKRLPEIIVKIELLSAEEIRNLLQVKEYKKGSAHLDFLRLTVQDNGLGVPEKDVPDLFGRVLTGSNYGARQTRGRFGLGAKMVLLNAMATVDLPIVVTSRFRKEKTTSEHQLFINLQRNEPKIVNKSIFKTPDSKAFKKSGTRVSVTFTGSWNLAKRYVKEYFHQLSIITPYSSFNVTLPDEEPLIFDRVVDEMPSEPKQTKIHPWGCDITQLKREISAPPYSTEMVSFLVSHLEGFTKKKAKEFLKFINIPENKIPKDLSASDIRRIVHDGFLVQEEQKKTRGKKKTKKKDSIFKFTRPSGSGLSPLGEDRLKRGLSVELNPQLIEVTTRPVNAYSGHAFIVEAALAYGGKQLEEERDESGKSSIRIYRFANRIPLLFGPGNDVVTKVINDSSMISWKDYKINLNTTPLAIAVSIVSTKIPYPETSKEYVAEVKELKEEIAEALKTLGARVRTHLSRRERADRERQRRGRFERFAPMVASALIDILKENDEQPYELNKLDLLLTRALVEGIPKAAQHRKPPSPSIRRIKQWINYPVNQRTELERKGIISAADFLAHPDKDLVLKTLPIDRIHYIKRTSILELDSDPSTPRVSILNLIPTKIENGFPKFEKITKSLSRRWISTVYDFFVAKDEDYLKVRGLNEKLWALYKQEIVDSLEYTGVFNAKLYKLESLHWITEEISDEFTSENIKNVPQFLLTFTNKFFNKKSFQKFHEYLLSFMKTEIKTNISSAKENINANAFPWLTGSAKKQLNVKKLKSWQDIIDTIDATPKVLYSNDDLLIGLINNLKEEIINLYEKSSQKLLINELDNFTALEKMILKKRKINSLYDLLLQESFPTSEHFLLYFKDFMSSKLKEWNKSQVGSLVNALVWIPEEIENNLAKINVFTIYDFLITPTNQLINSANGMLDKEYIIEMKRQYGIPLNYISPDIRDKLSHHGIVTTEELMHLLPHQQKELGKDVFNHVLEIQKILQRPIVFLPSLPFLHLNQLYHMGIHSIYDFLIWPGMELRKYLSDYLLFQLKNSVDLDEIESNHKKMIINLAPLEFLNKKAVDVVSKLEWTTVEEVLFSKSFQIADKYNSIGKSSKMSYSEVENAVQVLKHQIQAPIVFLPQVNPLKARQFLHKGLRTIMEFLYWPIDDLTELFPAKTDINGLRSTILSIRKGIPLGETQFFSGSEISALKEVGIRYIEEIYFTLNKHTFATPKVDWGRIRDVNNLLNLPVGLIVFEQVSEASTNPISTKKPISIDYVNALNKGEIYTILEFLITPPEYLSEVLNLNEKEAKHLQRTLKVKSEDEKIPLEPGLFGFSKSLIKELDNADISTLEDLYFASEEQFEEIPELLQTISSLRKALDCPLRLLPVFTPEMCSNLKERQINTLATFLMFPTNEIANILSISEERVEETYKRSIDILEISSLLETSISVITELSGRIQQELRQKGIKSFGDFVISTPEHFTMIASNPVLIKVYNRLTLKEIENNLKNAVNLLTQVLSKSLAQKVVKAGFASLQEIVFFAQESDFEPETWKELNYIIKLLKLPADYFLPSSHLETLKKFMIEGYIPVIDILAFSEENLKGRRVSVEELNQIKAFFDLDELIKLTRVPLRVIPNFTPSQISKLAEEKINFLGDFLLTSIKDQREILVWTQKDRTAFFRNLNLLETVEYLKVSPQIIFASYLSSEQFQSLSRKRIYTVLDLLTRDPVSINDIIGIAIDHIINQVNWQVYWEILNNSIYLAYPLPSLWRKNLAQTDYATIGKFLLAKDETLAQELRYSERYVSTNRSVLTLSSLLQSWEKQENWKVLLTHYLNVDVSSKKSIEIIIHDQAINVKEYKNLLELPLSSFTSLINDSVLKKLEDAEITVMWELLYWNFNDLQKTVKLTETDIKSIYKEIALSSLQEGFTKPLSLNEIPIITKINLKTLKTSGITTFEKLSISKDQPDSLPNKVVKIITKLYRNIQQPVLLLPELKYTQKINLLKNNWSSLSEILRNDTEIIADSLNMTPNEVETYLSTLSENKLEQYRMHHGNLINSLNALPDNVIQSIHDQTGLSDVTFEELIFTGINLNLNKSEKNHFDRFKEAYLAPLSFHQQLIEDYPEIYEKSRIANLNYIFEFISLSGSDLASLLDISEEIARKIRYSLDFEKIKKFMKREAIPLKPENKMINLNQTHIKRLAEVNITTIQSLLFPPYNLSKTDRKWVEPLSKKANKMFTLPISRLEGLKISTIPKLKKQGIENIGFFMVGSTKLLRTITKMKSSEITEIRDNPTLISKKKLQKTLDAMLSN